MDDYDVIVVGGGPGGSTAAGLTAAEGHRVLLLDKDVFPRYQIGESLLPATIHGICAMLGVRDDIERAGFVRKHGGTFKWGTRPEPWTFSFAASDRMAGPTSYAYQVERARFDTLLLDGARRLGAEVRQEHRALGTIRTGDRIGGVRYLDDTGRERRATARFVVDASGHGSRLHHDVGGTREYSPHFRNLALFGYFEGGGRMPAPGSGNILCVSFTDGWFWYIPLSDTLTSVGAVVKHSSANRVQGDPAAAYTSLIGECPLIGELLRNARRATEPPYDRLRVRKDYSYDRTALWAPGMVLVGDAACFIDPVFSSGVHLATYSALLAARSINSVLAGFADEKRCFAEFEARYRREFGLFRDFLVTFYELDTDEDAYFAHARQLTDHHGSDGEAFADLVGGVSSKDFSRAMFGDVLAEGVQLQLRGLLGEAAGDEPPMFPGGLVPTADGRRWRVPDA
ncbi:tryptophan 7-halogenase [Amycolatopsis sp. EV170708-02-1]|uniref:tryptophan 7-halogenase n=1 Tax=Amycolatopsis sp. EV170708-02-1 TaxID=2919322 RepID=UPI001F0CDBE5|nr:tryptophan 7-halogenase [Amycolatopsis sp. EV170708-02-1]UMP03432.1 tryptophan 7-halogenase [Amycolatopsis sp. EV170708-02-1]